MRSSTATEALTGWPPLSSNCPRKLINEGGCPKALGEPTQQSVKQAVKRRVNFLRFTFMIVDQKKRIQKNEDLQKG